MGQKQRLEEVYRQDPTVGRYKLAERAGVGEKAARSFLDRKRNSTTKIVVLCDWHIPYQDERALGCAFQFCATVKPEIIVVHEVHDFYTLSKFDKDPAREENLQDEIDIAARKFRVLRKNNPEARIILLGSNHLDRLRKYLWTIAPALARLRALQIESLLELDQHDIEFKDYFVYKGILFKHGDLTRKFSGWAAKAEFEKEGCAGVTGHTHRIGSFFTRKRGGSYAWVESGCLCDLNPDRRGVKGVADWQHGITMITFENDGTQYYMQPIPIINGKLIYGGKLISA